jgi:protein gp37
MTDRSPIEWTQATWNSVTGCDRISPGCDHYYALTLAARLKAMGRPSTRPTDASPNSGPGFGVAIHPQAPEEPLLHPADRCCRPVPAAPQQPLALLLLRCATRPALLEANRD